jgi:hypothetical protein
VAETAGLSLSDSPGGASPGSYPRVSRGHESIAHGKKRGPAAGLLHVPAGPRAASEPWRIVTGKVLMRKGPVRPRAQAQAGEVMRSHRLSGLPRVGGQSRTVSSSSPARPAWEAKPAGAAGKKTAGGAIRSPAVISARTPISPVATSHGVKSGSHRDSHSEITIVSSAAR